MPDNYQAVYDAVRASLSNTNVGDAVERVARDTFQIGHQVSNVLQILEYEHTRPSVLYRPSLSQDGNQWSALYGDNLQVGVAGFGDSPAKAMLAFDEAWIAV